MRSIYLAFICMAGLVACGGTDPAPAPVETNSIVDPMTEAMDKAKAVEGLEQERKRRMDEQLDNN